MAENKYATIMGLDVGWDGMGIGVVSVRATRPPGDLTSEWQFEERILFADTYRAKLPDNLRNADLYVADKDFLLSEDHAAYLIRLIHTLRPTVIAMELPAGGAKNARAMRCMGMASAVVAAIKASMRYYFTETELQNAEWLCRTPNQIKLAVLGRTANTPKDEMIAAVVAHYPLYTGWPQAKGTLEHACDAIGAIWSIRDTPAYRMAAIRGSN